MKLPKFLFPLLFCFFVAFTSCYDNADPNWDQTLGIKDTTNYLVFNEIEYEVTKITRLGLLDTVDGEETPLVSILFNTIDTNVFLRCELYDHSSLPYGDFPILETSDLPASTYCDFYFYSDAYDIESGMLTIEEAEEYGIKFTNYTFNFAFSGFTLTGKAKDFSY